MLLRWYFGGSGGLSKVRKKAEILESVGCGNQFCVLGRRLGDGEEGVLSI